MIKARCILVLALTGVYLWFLCIIANVYQADLEITKSRELVAAVEYDKALEKADLAIKRNSREPAYYRQRAKVYLAFCLNPVELEKPRYAELALKDLRRAEKLNPRNLATLRNSVPLYHFLARVEVQDDYLAEAGEYIRELKFRYSNDLGIITDAALYERKLELWEDYAISYEMAKNLRPDIITWHKAYIY